MKAKRKPGRADPEIDTGKTPEELLERMKRVMRGLIQVPKHEAIGPKHLRKREAT